MLVSVIIPAYNQGSYLRQAIQSVLDQTRQDFEIIVVDDGSTDDTQQVARSIDDPRVFYVYQSNRGLSGARNTGIRHSTGELLTFLDSDDLDLPDKHELLAAEFEKNPSLGLAAGTTKIINEHGDFIGKPFEAPIPGEIARLLLWNPLQVCSVMVHRKWIERVGPFDESLRAYEDWDMWLRLARHGCPMTWIANPVSLYRFHSRQMTQERQRMTTASFTMLDKIYADPNIPQDWLAMKDLAYSNSYLRDAIHAYRSEDYCGASQSLAEAVRLDPELAAGSGRMLARRLAALADSPKINDRLAFLERVYNHLPDGLKELEKQKNANLAALAVQQGFDAYRNGDWLSSRAFLWQAVRYHPIWLTNRGVLSILLRASFSGKRRTKEYPS